MRIIREFDKFNDVLSYDIDDIYFSKATISLSFFLGKDVTDLDKIRKMIEDYKVTYIKNDEWSGGPVNRDWISMYANEFGLTIDECFRLQRGFKPCVKLNIYIENFGVVKIGFSIYSKKAYSIDCENVGIKINCERCHGTGIGPTGQCTRYGCRNGKIDDVEYTREKARLSEYLRNTIYSKQMTYDEVVNKFDLQVEENFNYQSIEDYKKN